MTLKQNSKAGDYKAKSKQVRSDIWTHFSVVIDKINETGEENVNMKQMYVSIY